MVKQTDKVSYRAEEIYKIKSKIMKSLFINVFSSLTDKPSDQTFYILD